MTQSISLSRNSTVIDRFADISEFTPKIQFMIENGEIWGVYYSENGIVAEDVWGDIHKGIFN